MTLKEANILVKYIRKESYKTNPLQEQFLGSIEKGTIHVHGKTLSSTQVDLLKSISGKATMKG